MSRVEENKTTCIDKYVHLSYLGLKQLKQNE